MRRGIEQTQRKAAVVYCDPPWLTNQIGAKGASMKYDLMSSADIIGMAPAIEALTTENSCLFLWVTNNTLAEGLDVMRAWGYRYVSNAVWDKYYMGLGSYFRNSHELLLLGVRGKVQFKFRGQKSVFQFPRMGHSVKPAEMIPAIERLVDGPYLELFARARPNSREDWRIWGQEVDSDVSLSEWGYPVPSDFARQGSDGERSA